MQSTCLLFIYFVYSCNFKEAPKNSCLLKMQLLSIIVFIAVDVLLAFTNA